MIGCDNDRYYRAFDLLRAVLKQATLTHPDIKNLSLSDLKFAKTMSHWLPKISVVVVLSMMSGGPCELVIWSVERRSAGCVGDMGFGRSSGHSSRSIEWLDVLFRKKYWGCFVNGLSFVQPVIIHQKSPGQGVKHQIQKYNGRLNHFNIFDCWSHEAFQVWIWCLVFIIYRLL